MSKIKPEETTTALVTAPVNPMSLIPTAESMQDGFTEPSAGSFLPYLEMVYPVMVTTEHPEYRGNDYRLGFRNGQGFTCITPGTILTVVDKRNSARLKTEQDGVTKSEYAYSEIERAGQKYSKTAARYNELAAQSRANKDINVGYSAVIVALFPDGKTAVVNFAAYRTMAPYMYGAIGAANLQSKIGVRIDIEDHMPNLKKSAGDKYYLDSKKFKQWQHVQLTQDQIKKIGEAISGASDAYMNWVNS